MSHDNFKLNLTKRPRYVVRGVLNLVRCAEFSCQE